MVIITAIETFDINFFLINFLDFILFSHCTRSKLTLKLDYCIINETVVQLQGSSFYFFFEMIWGCAPFTPLRELKKSVF